jgi:hypothetical protein
LVVITDRKAISQARRGTPRQARRRESAGGIRAAARR